MCRSSSWGMRADFPVSTSRWRSSVACSCEVTGFSIGIGHDSSRLAFVDATPGPFLVDYAGEDLSFHVTGQNADGYALVGAFFDISFPVTVPPTSIERGTVLAVLTYAILPGVSPGPHRASQTGRGRLAEATLCRTSTLDHPGEPPVEPVLGDGNGDGRGTRE